MRVRHISGHTATFGLLLAIGACVSATPASAYARHAGSAHGGGHGQYAARYSSVSHFYRGGGLQCVPFARENTGIELAGNAATWWSAAQGVYERGARPEVGSVLNFRANGHMRMGHVAVVSNVVDGRNIEIDHANWAGPGASRGGVSRNITVVDVSPSNDWSAVRVMLGHSGEFGSVYPTYGFIYDRPDHGVMVANTGTTAAPVLNAAPADLRPATDRMMASTATESDEVAEASDDGQEGQPRLRRVSGQYRLGSHGGYARSYADRGFSARGHGAMSHASLARVEYGRSEARSSGRFATTSHGGYEHGRHGVEARTVAVYANSGRATPASRGQAHVASAVTHGHAAAHKRT